MCSIYLIFLLCEVWLKARLILQTRLMKGQLLSIEEWQDGSGMVARFGSQMPISPGKACSFSSQITWWWPKNRPIRWLWSCWCQEPQSIFCGKILQISVDLAHVWCVHFSTIFRDLLFWELHQPFSRPSGRMTAAENSYVFTTEFWTWRSKASDSDEVHIFLQNSRAANADFDNAGSTQMTSLRAQSHPSTWAIQCQCPASEIINWRWVSSRDYCDLI